MKVLVACEESQVVTIAFRNKGHEAYSCDILPCSGGHPEWHLQIDAFKAIALNGWDLIIMHPPCTAIAVSGNRWYGYKMKNHADRIKSVAWTKQLWDSAIKLCDRVCLENPVGVLNKYTIMPKPQYIQPWQFGHGETKKTGLWLHNLPILQPENLVTGREGKVWKMSPGPERSKLRSKTYKGIAEAMANQWNL